MSSVIKVDEIQTATGGTKVFDMIRELDMWRLSTTVNPQNSIVTAWERPTGTNINVFPVPIGTGLTLEDGVFSFPTTGYYRIDAIIGFKTVQQNGFHEMTLKVSNDNGNNYTDYVQASMGQPNNNQYVESCSIKFFINVKNVSGDNATKFNFTTLNDSTAETILGYANPTVGYGGDDVVNLTYFTCQRLAPPIG